MKREQLSNRIGNIEDRLVEQARNAPDFGQYRRNRGVRRMAFAAAVLVLMIGSFAVGAIALAKETIVYVEKEQEIVKVGDSGISLILPDEWKDKYGYELDGDNLTVYHLATRESFEYGGVLFWIDRVDERYPLDYTYPEPAFTIAITENSTYRFRLPSDIQIDINSPEAWAEYDKLSEEIVSIEIIMTSQMLASTTNASNWVQGTVSVSYLEAGTVTRTVFCGIEQSEKIKEIVESQDYSLEQGSFLSDLLIMFDGAEYYMNSTTGSIENAGGHPYSAVLSTEDLEIIMGLLDE
ncbi:MAG: hypothetical protein FWH57_07350 [Oscillospiraceae bacterium]|nr:hypothetical protein [Oscillospiraceae bacterium]